MGAKLVRFSQEAREKILRGVNVLADAYEIPVDPFSDDEGVADHARQRRSFA